MNQVRHMYIPAPQSSCCAPSPPWHIPGTRGFASPRHAHIVPGTSYAPDTFEVPDVLIPRYFAHSHLMPPIILISRPHIALPLIPLMPLIPLGLLNLRMKSNMFPDLATALQRCLEQGLWRWNEVLRGGMGT
eukprot:28018-Pelagomonas_calceolata.AAC.3